MKLSSTAIKLKKAKAYELIKRLHEGKQLTHTETSCLLLHFAPAIPKKANTDWNFVRGAVAKKDHRYHLNYVYVKDGIMNGCDGYILRQAATDLEDGSYCPKTGALIDPDQAGTYPDINRVKPDVSTLDEIDFKITEREYMCGAPHSKVNGHWYRDDYLLPVVEYMTDAYVHSKDGKLVFKKGNTYALILPVQK